MDTTSNPQEVVRLIETCGYSIRYTHSYLSFRELKTDPKNPLRSFSGDELNAELKRIVEECAPYADLIESWDHGLGGLRSMVFRVCHSGYWWFFAMDPLYASLLRSYPVKSRSELIPTLRDVILAGHQYDKVSSKGWLHKHSAYGYEYLVLNSYEAYVGFYNDNELVSELNGPYWRDLQNYMNNRPCRGKHTLLQVGLLIVDVGFERGDLDLTTTKVVPLDW